MPAAWRARDRQRECGWSSITFSYIRLCYSCRVGTKATPVVPPESFLPLNRDTFHILVSLADRDRHGYAVMQDVRERTDGALRLSPSSLYAAIRRLLTQGLIEELTERPDPEHDDERRRYYRITTFGIDTAKAEARRLTQLVKLARQSGFAAGRI